MAPFLVYLALDQFKRATLDGPTPAGTIHIQSRSTHGGREIPTTTYAITLSAEAGGRLHLAHVPVETAELWGPPGEAPRIQAACAARAEQAEALIAAHFRNYHPPIVIAPGMLLEPGALSELRSVHTSQNLWRITTPSARQTSDPLARQLTPIMPTGGGDPLPEYILA